MSITPTSSKARALMEHLPTIYAAAVLLPLASFFTILIFARQLGRVAGAIATGAILIAGVLSFVGFGLWINEHFPQAVQHGGDTQSGEHLHGEASRKGIELPATKVAPLQEPTQARAGEAKGG